MTPDIRPYPAVKDSGVEPLGELPEHWEVRKLRHILRRHTERNQPELPLLSVVREKGVILRDRTNTEENHNYIPDDLSNYKVVCAGQFTMNKMKAWQGSYGVSRYDGIVSPAYFVFDLSGVKERFFHLAIRSRAYVPQFTQASDGVRVGQWDLSDPRMREIPFVVPPVAEQAAIVRFLDHADRRLQRAIRVKQKLIKLLEEQKQAIVHRAVTRGLDPDARLKPSGVEWLGDVPEHWEVKKLRQCVLITGGMTPSMEERRFWDGSIPWVTPKDMKSDVISGSTIRVTDAAVQETSLRLVDAPAILMVVRGMILAKRVPIAWTNTPVTVNQDMKVLRPLGGIDAKFLAQQLISAGEALKPLIDEASHGTRRLPTERWRDIAVTLPPKHEQQAICLRLKRSTHKIATAVDRVQRQVAALREYRTRLIADVVTGKLDVREAAARLPEEREQEYPGDVEAPVEEMDEDAADEPEPITDEVEA